MAATEQPAVIDTEKLMGFVFRAVDEIGATLNTAPVVMGGRRGPNSGSGYDLVTMFDCLHDMGDPVGAIRHVRQSLPADGTWMIVEPIAGDRVEDNFNLIRRAHYGFSTLLCTPASLSQDVGLALCGQADESRIRDVVTRAGLAASAASARRRSTSSTRPSRSQCPGQVQQPDRTWPEPQTIAWRRQDFHGDGGLPVGREGDESAHTRSRWLRRA
jgi:hypothetical protein